MTEQQKIGTEGKKKNYAALSCCSYCVLFPEKYEVPEAKDGISQEGGLHVDKTILDSR